jgi:hypothetical protein
LNAPRRAIARVSQCARPLELTEQRWQQPTAVPTDRQITLRAVQRDADTALARCLQNRFDPDAIRGIAKWEFEMEEEPVKVVEKRASIGVNQVQIKVVAHSCDGPDE